MRSYLILFKIINLYNYSLGISKVIDRLERKEFPQVKFAFILEPTIGFEPTTLSLRMKCSTS